MQSINPFKVVESPRLARSVFDLSNRRLLSAKFGQLLPVFHEECLPGDKFWLNAQMLIRMQPMNAPIMHEINAFVHYFFVATRLLWPKPDYVNDPPVLESGSWERFITGGPDGDDASTPPVIPAGTFAAKSLYDYFGLPIGVAIPVGSEPIRFPIRAYNLIYNDYYRDENLIDPYDLDSSTIKLRAWEKDYFTSALLFQQRGTAPSMPLGGTAIATFTGSAGFNNTLLPVGIQMSGSGANNPIGANVASGGTQWGGSGALQNIISGTWSETGARPLGINASLLTTHNTVDLSSAGGQFTIPELRFVSAVQQLKERDARTGVRYTEFLKGHWSVAPRDERLQRPEYIGGVRTPVIVNEVLQTSENDTQTEPTGQMYGHGLAVDHQFAGEYFCQEFGYIIGILSIMPRPMYKAQGMHRTWLRRSRFDFPFPEFNNLSEQGILNMEIYTGTSNITNQTVFGFQGQYDEKRVLPSLAVGDFRTTLDYWHLAREFSVVPTLSQEFIELDQTAQDMDRIFAVESEDGFLCSIGNIVKAARPLPILPIPGLGRI